MKLLPLGKSFLPLVAFGHSGKNDSPCGNNFIPTRAIGQESYIFNQSLGPKGLIFLKHENTYECKCTYFYTEWNRRGTQKIRSRHKQQSNILSTISFYGYFYLQSHFQSFLINVARMGINFEVYRYEWKLV